MNLLPSATFLVHLVPSHRSGPLTFNKKMGIRVSSTRRRVKSRFLSVVSLFRAHSFAVPFSTHKCRTSKTLTGAAFSLCRDPQPKRRGRRQCSVNVTACGSPCKCRDQQRVFGCFLGIRAPSANGGEHCQVCTRKWRIAGYERLARASGRGKNLNTVLIRSCRCERLTYSCHAR